MATSPPIPKSTPKIAPRAVAEEEEEEEEQVAELVPGTCASTIGPAFAQLPPIWLLT